jgi:hypothetical protein
MIKYYNLLLLSLEHEKNIENFQCDEISSENTDKRIKTKIPD